LGAGRRAGFGAEARSAGFLAAAFFFGAADFLWIAGFFAGVFLGLTLVFGFFFAAAMAPPGQI